MPVHAQSVIPTWVNTYNPTFYNKLTTMENTSYTGTGNNTVTNWRPLFTNLANALDSWKNVNRQTALSNFITAYYSYYTMNQMFGTDGSLISAATASTVFDINGFIATTLGRADNYYGDIVLGPPVSSAKMTADVTAVNNASAAELSELSSLQNSFQGVVAGQVSRSLFQDIPPTNPFPGKAGMAQQIFITRGYKLIYQTLNVGSLTLPPGV